MDTHLKICTKCKIAQSRKNFNFSARYSDGLRIYCKSCCLWISRIYYSTKKGKESRKRTYKRQWEKADGYYKRLRSDPEKLAALKKYSKSYCATHRLKISERNRKWYSIPENKEARKLYQKTYFSIPENAAALKERQRKRNATPAMRERKIRWSHTEAGREAAIRRRHVRRVREKDNGGKLSKGIRSMLLMQQGFLCANCKILVSTKNCHLDHIYPLSKGGMNTDGNIQILCKTCNLLKRDKLPHEWSENQRVAIYL